MPGQVYKAKVMPEWWGAIILLVWKEFQEKEE